MARDPVAQNPVAQNVRRFGALWDDYANKILPEEASAVQVQETRRAFYAGGVSLLKTMVTILDEDAEPTEEDLRAMDDLNEEFHAFARELAAGRA